MARVLGLLVDVAVWLGLAAVAAATAVRLAGFDRGTHAVALLAVTPYVLGAAGVLLLVALARRRVAAIVATTVVAAVLAAVVVPRTVADDQPTGAGVDLVVASSNLKYGRGAGPGIVDLVRERRVDVLVLLELTPAAIAELDRLGLGSELPHRVFYSGPGTGGTGIASRHPLSQRVLLPPSVLRQPAAVVDVPGAREVEVQAVHPVQPFSIFSDLTWREELAALPTPVPPDSGRDAVRLLVGDFNATLDHPALHRLLDAGYVDAADQAGEGLRATWPTDRGLWGPPPVTLDHVLADERCAVRSFDVVDVPRSDHRAIVAELTVPARRRS